MIWMKQWLWQKKIEFWCVYNNELQSQHHSSVNVGDVARSSAKPDVDEGDDAEVLIECRNVYKSFGEKHILQGASFQVSSYLLPRLFESA